MTSKNMLYLFLTSATMFLGLESLLATNENSNENLNKNTISSKINCDGLVVKEQKIVSIKPNTILLKFKLTYNGSDKIDIKKARIGLNITSTKNVNNFKFINHLH